MDVGGRASSGTNAESNAGAVAEAAALLVLQKKFHAFLGGEVI